MNRVALLAAVPLVAALLACGADESSSTGGSGTPAADTITMEPNTQPTYGWNLGSADTIEVARTNDLATPVWRAVRVDLDGIGSGVTHGTTGADRNVTVTTETVLTTGIAYRVRIVRLTGGSVVMKTFTVQP
jgi:hypothetical protein